MLDEFQEIHSGPSELRLDCCEWFAGRIPELSILVGLGLVCADVHPKEWMAGASTGYAARVQFSNVGRRMKARLAQ
jgi:hypothetical protein